MEFEIVKIGIDAVTSLALIGAVIFAAKQTQALRQQTGALKSEIELLKWSNGEAHDWNRRDKTSEILIFLTTGEFVRLRQRIRKYRPLANSDDFNYTKYTEGLPSGELAEMHNNLTRLFNFFEVIAILVRHKIIDGEVLFDYLAIIYTQEASWADSYIRTQRKTDNPLLWVRFTELAVEWSVMLKALEEEKCKAGLISAKPMLGAN